MFVGPEIGFTTLASSLPGCNLYYVQSGLQMIRAAEHLTEEPERAGVAQADLLD